MLPFQGLALSTNSQQRDTPHPYRLLETSPSAFDVLEYSAPLDIDEARAEATLFATMESKRLQVPLLFHPVHLNLWGPHLESTDRLEALAKHLQTIHSPWVSNDVGFWHVDGAGLPGALYVTPPLTSEGLAQAVTHARHVASALPVPLLLENPVVMTARGELHVLDFMERLSQATGCALVLDIGHLVSHQFARGRALTDGLSAFDFSRVAEIHLAGGVITRRGDRRHYLDDHPQGLRDEVWQLLTEVLPRCRALRCLTFEGDGHSQASALSILTKLRGLWRPDATASFPHFTAPPAAPPAALDAAWHVFTDTHRGHCADDPEGATAELDFRLAVIAQALDQSLPLSRLAVASTREALADFAASAEFLESLQAGRDLTDGFARWSASKARGTPGAEPLVSLEAMARALAPRRRAPMPPVGTFGLGPHVGLLTFPHQLAEALHAAKVLPRHLTSRAWASASGLEASGVEGVLQAAARAQPTPWQVLVRRTGEGCELLAPERPVIEVAKRCQRQPLQWGEAAALAPEALLRGAVREGWLAFGTPLEEKVDAHHPVEGRLPRGDN